MNWTHDHNYFRVLPDIKREIDKEECGNSMAIIKTEPANTEEDISLMKTIKPEPSELPMSPDKANIKKEDTTEEEPNIKSEPNAEVVKKLCLLKACGTLFESLTSSDDDDEELIVLYLLSKKRQYRRNQRTQE